MTELLTYVDDQTGRMQSVVHGGVVLLSLQTAVTRSTGPRVNVSEGRRGEPVDVVF